MRMFRVHHHVICLLAAGLLVAQSLVAGHVPIRETVVYEPVLGAMIICSSRGAVDNKYTGQPPVPSEHKSHCPCCAFGCFAGCGGGAIAAVAGFESAALVDFIGSALYVPLPPDRSANFLRLTTTHPRAPPPLIS